MAGDRKVCLASPREGARKSKPTYLSPTAQREDQSASRIAASTRSVSMERTGEVRSLDSADGPVSQRTILSPSAEQVRYTDLLPRRFNGHEPHSWIPAMETCFATAKTPECAKGASARGLFDEKRNVWHLALYKGHRDVAWKRSRRIS